MTQPSAILFAAGCLLTTLPAVSQSRDSVSSGRERLNEVIRPQTRTMVGLLFSVSSDTWQPHYYKATAEGVGYGFGISVMHAIRRSARWSIGMEFTGRKYANQLLESTTWTETIKEAGVKINFLVRYRFDQTFLRPYVGVGFYGGLGLNGGSGQKGGSVVSTFYVGSGGILNAGIHLHENILLDFRYENSSGTTSFNVLQGGLIFHFDPD